MFSIIRKLWSRAKSFAALSERVERVEIALDQFEALADENASLWQYIDDQREMASVFVGSQEEFEEEFTDIMLRNLKTRGDA